MALVFMCTRCPNKVSMRKKEVSKERQVLMLGEFGEFASARGNGPVRLGSSIAASVGLLSCPSICGREFDGRSTETALCVHFCAHQSTALRYPTLQSRPNGSTPRSGIARLKGSSIVQSSSPSPLPIAEMVHSAGQCHCLQDRRYCIWHDKLHCSLVPRRHGKALL